MSNVLPASVVYFVTPFILFLAPLFTLMRRFRADTLRKNNPMALDSLRDPTVISLHSTINITAIGRSLSNLSFVSPTPHTKASPRIKLELLSTLLFVVWHARH